MRDQTTKIWQHVRQTSPLWPQEKSCQTVILTAHKNEGNQWKNEVDLALSPLCAAFLAKRERV